MKLMDKAQNTSKKKILLVDDELAILKLLEFILKDEYELDRKSVV